MEPPPPRIASQGRSPSRPSSQATKKANLARSHPQILERALSRSPTRKSARKDDQQEAETRAFGLRDRKALRPSITLAASPTDSLKRDQQSTLTFTSRRSSGLGAFAAPPRRVSKRISASELLFQSPTASQEIRMEASVVNTPDNQLVSELGSATGPTSSSGDMEGPSLHDEFDEPDLPPTPTQLGLEPPPGRPRGLLSSSPSIQHGKWGKRRVMGDLENSPSKLRTVDYGNEPENLMGPVATMNDTLFPESVVKKRKIRRDLSADLESLKQDIVKLEGLCEKFEREGENIEPYLSDLGSLLISTDQYRANSTNSSSNNHTVSSLISTLLPFSSKRPPKPRRLVPELNPFALDQNAQADLYLSAFAPLKITASSNITSTSKSGHFVERHQLALSAPRPFPPNLYKISVFYDTNLETQSLVSLSANVDDRTLGYLRQWTKRRLENPLLKFDVSGLCWGINRYWEAVVSRAQIWAQLETQHPGLLAGRKKSTDSRKHKKAGDLDLGSEEILTTFDMRRILPHLERTSMFFKSKQRSLEVLLSCELTIDEWTGEPELAPSICVSTSGFDNSSNEKVEQESKKLFQTILGENMMHQPETAGGFDAQAIVEATSCILNTLFGENGEEK